MSGEEDREELVTTTLPAAQKEYVLYFLCVLSSSYDLLIKCPKLSLASVQNGESTSENITAYLSKEFLENLTLKWQLLW